MNILMKIQQDYLQFAQQERRVADYILKNSSDIGNIKINMLAKDTNTSNTTITRFCKKIGCDSFSELKFQIYNSSKKKKVQKKNITDEVFDFYQTVIENTQNMTKVEDLAKFMKLIMQVEEILVIGLSSTGGSANTLAVRLMRMGLNAQCISDVSWMRMKAKVINKNTLVIALSLTGVTDVIKETVEISKKNGAKVISLTNYTKNEISNLADLSLYVYSTKFINDERFINSQFSMMYLIDVITTYLMQNEELNKIMKKTF